MYNKRQYNEDTKYLQFSSVCQHPKIITTKSGERMQVSCGRCLACRMQNARERNNILQHEFANKRYAFFVTLTYSNDNVPLMCPVATDGKHNGHIIYNFFDIDTDEFVTTCDLSKNQLSYLQSKGINGNIKYLRYTDVQKFLKRLRKNLSKYDNESIRYFLVGEYGPSQLRPHFHILFFFSSPRLYPIFRDCLYKAWTLGYIDAQLPKNYGQSSKYLAAYVNGFVYLPHLLQCKQIRQKCLHSQALGFSADETIYEEVRQGRFDRFNEYCNKALGETYDHHSTAAWRSLENYFFPKCRRFNELNNSELRRIYASSNRLQTICLRHGYQGDLIMSRLVNYLYDILIPNNILTDYEKSLLFVYSSGSEAIDTPLPLRENFLAEIYISRHFNRMCARLSIPADRYLEIIDDYYRQRTYNALCNFLSLCESASIDSSELQLYAIGAAYNNLHTCDDINLSGIVYNCNELKSLLSNSSVNIMCRNINMSCLHSQIKHRKLNEQFFNV
ncbi:replication initiator protein [Microvirus sp.]|nr:replication initiator protein [Microvirus sp.]